MANTFLARTDTHTSWRPSGEGDDSVKQQTVKSPTNARSTRRRTTVSHRKVVFSDPVAFRYLEEDESTIVIDRWKRLQGYELYAVEQWACSRTHPTFVICTYTGDVTKSALVNVLAIPNDKSKWSRRLKIYFDAVSQFHAREQETPLGTLMVTNLSGFPSALAVIPVPDGDIKRHREDFIVNENLKRMGCAGRAAITLSEPPPSMITKFHHLYQTSESIHFKSAVIELVKICQIALVLYGKLDSIYTDGLLCDITERAISDWWNDIGTDFHNVEPSDGILGPTTVSAILGLLIGAYNRLKSAGIAIGKDVLDVNSMKHAIGSFQKAAKIERTRRLDRDTLDRLHRATAKTASGDGWTVPRAVKSTVAELSGKGGEMIMGVVGGGRDKAGISEVETLDIDRLAHLVPGSKMKWLWQGKRLKAQSTDPQADEGNDWVFSTDNAGNFLWKSGSLEDLNGQADGSTAQALHNEGKLGRIRGAVPGLRSHNPRASRDFDGEEASTDALTKPLKVPFDHRPFDHVKRRSSSSDARRHLEHTLSEKVPFNLALAGEDTLSTPGPRAQKRSQPVHSPIETNPRSHREQLRALNRPAPDSPGKKRARAELRTIRDEIKADVYQNFATEFDEQAPEAMVLRRSRSAILVRELEDKEMRLLGIPRRLSYSIVEGTTIQPTEALELDKVLSNQESSLPYQMAAREAEKRELKQLAAKIIDLEQLLLPYAENEMMRVVDLDMEAREHLSELNNIYYGKLDDYQSLQATSTELVARDKVSLNDGVRRVETLGNKLDYELSALHSRMQEVEDGAAEFEKNVLEVEARVVQLVDERRSNSDPMSIPLFQRLINFIGSRK